METGVTRFHFSIKSDPRFPLNFTHEYQIVFIEPSDGSHVFGVQLGEAALVELFFYLDGDGRQLILFPCM